MRPSRTGGGVAPGGANAGAPPPVITTANPSFVAWTWSGPDPDHWQVFYSNTRYGIVIASAAYPGGDRDNGGDVPPAPSWVWIIGQDSGGANVTTISAPVEIP